MSAVENKVLSMKFDKSNFVTGVQAVLNALGKLKTAMDGTKTKKNLVEPGDISRASNEVQKLGSSFDGVKSHASAMTIAVGVALGGLVTKAATAGASIAKSLTIQPAMDGLREYETNLNSVQTILSNTKASGATLDDVNRTLAELNTYSDQTIYNFSEMASNIGTFTAAGVDLKTSASSIKGIANLAALSGSNSQQASTAMYQLSQAIAGGKVSLEDWNSVVNAGMGGATFQRALAETAVRMGTLDESALKLDGSMKNVKINGKSFRDSITAKPGKESWLSKDVLTGTLQQFTGDLTDAELKAKGFSDQQVKNIQDMAKTAKAAATEVKTLSGVFDVAKESTGSGWAQTWQIIFGDFGEAKQLFTGMSNGLSKIISDNADARNKVLTEWKSLGGRDDLIAGLSSAFKLLGQVIQPVKEAFREVFPPTTGAQLASITRSIKEFIQSLTFSSETAGKVKSIFKGFFSIFSIGIQFVTSLGKAIFGAFSGLGQHSSGLLTFAARIGDFISGIDDAIKKGDLFDKFFANIGEVISTASEGIQPFVEKFENFVKTIGSPILSKATDVLERLGGSFSEFKPTVMKDAGDAVDKMGRRFEPVTSIFDRFRDGLNRLGSALSWFWEVGGKIMDKIHEAFSGFGQNIADAISSGDYSAALDTINTGLLGGIVLLIRKFIDNGLKFDFGEDGPGGMIASIKESFETLTGTMESVQQRLQAKTLMDIAKAIGILTISVVALSLIDSSKLTTALTAMGAAFGELMVSMALLTKLTGSQGFVKIPAISTALISLASAMVLLSLAVKVLSTMSWNDLLKGLTGVLGLVIAMGVAMKTMGDGKAKFAIASTGLISMSVALNLMVPALKALGGMSWGDMIQGITGVTAGLIGIGAAMRIMPNNMPITGSGLVLVASGLNLVYFAIKSFGSISLSDLAMGLLGIGTSMITVAGAMNLMPKDMALTAVGLGLVSAALTVMAGVVTTFGEMSWEAIGKGLVTLAGSLGLLTLVMNAMVGALPGAAAMVTAAAALAILTPVLLTLGTMSWEAIAKGIVAMAGAFTVFGLAAVVLGPLTPIIIGLSAAMVLFGGGLALAGGGLLAFATAFGIFAGIGAGAFEILKKALGIIIDSIPKTIKAFGEGLAEFAGVIYRRAPEFAKAFGAVLKGVLEQVTNAIPQIIELMGRLLSAALKTIRDKAPEFISTGWSLLKSFLSGIRDHIGEIVELAADIMIQFMQGLANKAPALMDQAAKLIVAFVRGLAGAVRNNMEAMRSAGWQLAKAIADGMSGGLVSQMGNVKDKAMGMARSVVSTVKGALRIFSPSKVMTKLGQFTGEGFAKGIELKHKRAIEVARMMSKKVAKAVASGKMSKKEGRERQRKIQDMLRKENFQYVMAKNKLMRDRAEEMKRRITKAPVARRLTNDELRRDRNPKPEFDQQNLPFVFNQYNHSPKELDAIDIYRNTRSAVAQVTGKSIAGAYRAPQNGR